MDFPLIYKYLNQPFRMKLLFQFHNVRFRERESGQIKGIYMVRDRDWI